MGFRPGVGEVDMKNLGFRVPGLGFRVDMNKNVGSPGM